MLSLPVIRDVHIPLWVIMSALVYFAILFFVLKTFQYNKDRFEE
jgi:hypothetical protein